MAPRIARSVVIMKQQETVKKGKHVLRLKFEVLGGVNPPYASGEVAKEKQGI